MTSDCVPDTALFDPANIPEEMDLQNKHILDQTRNAPDVWSLSIDAVRKVRASGRGLFGPVIKSERAEIVTIEGPRGPLDLRIISPNNPKGAFLHMHGGGWVFGTADMQDPRLEYIADQCNLACVSVEYAMAPENPYPAAPDDCEAAALWLLDEGAKRFGIERLAIGGESAGAQLALVTLLRLRDKHGLLPFRASLLTTGIYDLGMTPSMRNWGKDKLVLNTRDMEHFIAHFLQNDENKRDPDISPIYADMTSMPECLLTAGTMDPLLDDSLFLNQRMIAAGIPTQMEIFPGACHVFQSFESAATTKSLNQMSSFLNQALS